MNPLPRVQQTRRTHAIRAALLGALALASHATAEITTFLNDEAGWLAAAGAVTTIDFVERSTPPGGIEHLYYNHYEPLGVLLTYPGGLDPSVPWWRRFDSTLPSFGPLLRDNGGLLYPVNTTGILGFRFDQPIHAFALVPLAISGGADTYFSLWLGGRFIGNRNLYTSQSSHRGLYSDEPFDEVRLNYQFSLDNIYFQTVPAPGVLAAMAIAMPVVRRRRR